MMMMMLIMIIIIIIIIIKGVEGVLFSSVIGQSFASFYGSHCLIYCPFLFLIFFISHNSIKVGNPY